MDNKVLGNLLRDCRLSKGLTQEVLSGLADIDESYLCKIESGLMNPTINLLYKLTDTMEVRLSDILRLAEETENSKP